MKVFKKVFAFAIALTAIAMASSAMASNAVYEDGKVSVENTFVGDTQTTVAVVASDFGETDANVDDIYYINQDTAANIGDLLNNGVALLDKAGFVAGETEVRVGGNGNYVAYAIPKMEQLSTNTITPDAGAEERRFGFHGTYQFNGGTVSAIKFVLTSEGHDSALYEDEVDFDTNSANIEQFLGSLPSVVGEVSFGLEVANVPAGVTVTLSSVEVVE